MVLSREQKVEEQKAAQVKADLKAFLKSQAKNALIGMIFDQLELYQELQGICRQILDEKNELKAKYEPETPTPEEKV